MSIIVIYSNVLLSSYLVNNTLLQISWNLLTDIYEISNLVENKRDNLIVCSILYLTKRWDEFYFRTQNSKSIKTDSQGKKLNENGNYEDDLELFSKTLNVDQNEALGIIKFIKIRAFKGNTFKIIEIINPYNFYFRILI